MLRPLVLTALLAAGLSGAAYADVFRWVDDHGEVHYTDRWVPGAQLISSNRPHPELAAPSGAQDKGRDAKPASASSPDKAKDKAAEEAVKKDVAKVKEEQCKQAQDRYQKAIEARRIYKAPKEGDTDRVFMSDDETDAYRVQARNDVTLACGSPPAPAQ